MGDDLMIDNMSLYNAFREVPDSAKRPITGGRMNGKTDINPIWRIKSLTEQFGPCGIGWYYIPVKKWLETYDDVVLAFVDIELYMHFNGEWSKPICGTGGNMLAEKEKGGIHVSDECFKMATTDAISVACKQLGIGADVYWGEDATKYTVGAVQSDSQKELDPRFKKIESELIRTGYSVESVKKTYKLADIRDMSDLQIKDFLKKVKNLPDKVVS